MIKINRNAKKNGSCVVTWAELCWKQGLKRDCFCATLGSILEGANCPGANCLGNDHQLISVSHSAPSCENWLLQLNPKCVLGKHLKNNPELSLSASEDFKSMFPAETLWAYRYAELQLRPFTQDSAIFTVSLLMYLLCQDQKISAVAKLAHECILQTAEVRN